jgi:glycosyltransferase involved in cell wall biosynthesis
MMAAGPRATHIVLCEDMARRLRRWYPVADVLVISNAVMIDRGNATPRPRSELERVGFLGNVSLEKGIDVFLDVAVALARSGPKLDMVVAGPIIDSRLRATLPNRMRDLGIRYVGPQYGRERAAFYESIDALLFPSRYPHEADPMTVHEALAAGIPVISSKRGCLGCGDSSEPALTAVPEADFADRAGNLIRRWVESPSEFREASTAAVATFEMLRARDCPRYDLLLDSLVGLADGAAT